MSISVAVCLFIVVSLSACGTLEVGVEGTVTPVSATPTLALPSAETPTRAPDPTWTPEPTPTTPALALPSAETPTRAPNPTWTPEPTPTSIPRPSTLHVAILRGGNIWFWTADEPQAVPLTHDGDAGDIKLSTDGAIVAFMRSDASLWAVNTDGAGERQLVSAGDFAAMQPTDPGVTLHRFEWIPGTHILAYSTRLRTQVASPLSGDLRLVDADTLERTVLLPPGEGGETTLVTAGETYSIMNRWSRTMDFNTMPGRFGRPIPLRCGWRCRRPTSVHSRLD